MNSHDDHLLCLAFYNLTMLGKLYRFQSTPRVMWLLFRRRYTIQSSLSSITKLRPTITFLSAASTSRVPRGNKFRLHLSSTNYYSSFIRHPSQSITQCQPNKNKKENN